MNEKILDISWGTIVKIFTAAVVFLVLYSIRDILIWFIFALTISLLFEPAIGFLQKRRAPRILAVVLLYVAIFGIFSILIYLMVPIFATEIEKFINFFPEYFGKISPLIASLGFETFSNLEMFLKTFQGTLQGMGENIFNTLFSLFGGVFTTLFVIVVAMFLSLEDRAVEKALILLFPKKYEVQAINIWQKCQKKVSGWFGGRLIGCIFVGVASYIAFLIFGVKYPFTLALFSGVFNFVPYVGPVITGLILFLIVFPVSVVKGILAVVALVIIQEIENNIISPILMKKLVGLPPVLVLLSLVIGGKLWGFMGAVLAIPLFGILFEFLNGFLQKKKDRETVIV